MPPKAAAKPVVAKVAKPTIVAKPKPTPPTHDHCAVCVDMPPKTDNTAYTFKEAVDFYKKEFMKEVCVNKAFMDHQALKKHEINPKTRSPYNSYIKSYQYKYDDYNSVKCNDKFISMTQFLTYEKFCNDVINHYNKLGYDCEIYDYKTNRNTKVCIKIKF